MILKRFFWVLTFLFVLLNVIAFNHAYKFTHFTQAGFERTKDPKELTPLSRTKVLFTGITNPRPTRKCLPTLSFSTINIKSDVMLEAWHVQTENSRGTVIMFHGYSGEKSSLISRAEEFARMGYSTLLVDFMGCGGSEGEGTTIGYTEAREVKDAFDYIRNLGENNIHLFGTSMGAAAVLKAIQDYRLQASSLILECPFGSLYKTVCARFNLLDVPSFPLAGILTFWGGFQQGYWAFGHNPYKYATSVTIPSLLLYGEKDDRVSMEETEMIFNGLRGKKKLVTYPDAGHQLFTPENSSAWVRDVNRFMNDMNTENEKVMIEKVTSR